MGLAWGFKLKIGGLRGTGPFEFIHITEIVKRIMSMKFMVMIALYFEAEYPDHHCDHNKRLAQKARESSGMSLTETSLKSSETVPRAAVVAHDDPLPQAGGHKDSNLEMLFQGPHA